MHIHGLKSGITHNIRQCWYRHPAKSNGIVKQKLSWKKIEEMFEERCVFDSSIYNDMKVFWRVSNYMLFSGEQVSLICKYNKYVNIMRTMLFCMRFLNLWYSGYVADTRLQNIFAIRTLNILFIIKKFYVVNIFWITLK